MNFDRWTQWLLYASVFFVVFGIVVAIAPNLPLLAIWTAKADALFFPQRIHPNASALRAFMMGPLGATVAGSYLLQSFVVTFAFRRGEAWAWHAILWSTLLWLTVDTAVSVLHGAYFNIYLINIFPLIVFGIPLFATRSILKKKDD
jgi:hypothetical protein